MVHLDFDFNDYGYLDRLKKCKMIDWRLLGKVSSVKNMSPNCQAGSWAFSVAETIESLAAINHQVENAENVQSFSVQQLLDCNFGPNLGCVGGRREFGFNYTINNGITYEKNYPYNATTTGKQDCLYNSHSDNIF